MCKLQSSAALSREIPLLTTYGWGMCSQAHDSELNHTQPVSAHLSRAPHIPLAFVSSPQVTVSPGVLPPSLSWVKISLLLLGVTSTRSPPCYLLAGELSSCQRIWRLRNSPGPTTTQAWLFLFPSWVFPPSSTRSSVPGKGNPCLRTHCHLWTRRSQHHRPCRSRSPRC